MCTDLTVTVCIPAYQAQDFIVQTVQSVLAQTHSAWRLLIALDPPDQLQLADATWEVLQPLLSDSRIQVMRNPQRLGWAANIRALLQQVSTPFYAILPHDDLWSPYYLATLLAALEQQPQAVVAYGDLYFFGHAQPRRKAVRLPSTATRAEHLLQFALQGAEAMPWRGVTRSASLASTGGFPVDAYQGLAVECEYALALLAVGAVLHVPRVMYFKRMHSSERLTASQARLQGVALTQRYAGWYEHKQRMQAWLAQGLRTLPADVEWTRLCELALESALLRRLQEFVQPELSADDYQRWQQALQQLSALAHSPAAAQIESRLRFIAARHHLALNQLPLALQYAQAAAALDSEFPEAALLLAQLYSQLNQPFLALEWAAEAVRLQVPGVNCPATALIQQLYPCVFQP